MRLVRTKEPQLLEVAQFSKNKSSSFFGIFRGIPLLVYKEEENMSQETLNLPTLDSAVRFKMEKKFYLSAVILLMFASLLASLEERHCKHVCLSEIKKKWAATWEDKRCGFWPGWHKPGCTANGDG